MQSGTGNFKSQRKILYNSYSNRCWYYEFSLTKYTTEKANSAIYSFGYQKLKNEVEKTLVQTS